MNFKQIVLFLVLIELSFLILASSESMLVNANGNGAPILSNPEPANGATDAYTNPKLSVAVRDPEGQRVSIWFSTNATGIWKDIRVLTNVAGGTYSVVPTSMTSLGTKYFWRVTTTDGADWTKATYSLRITSTGLRLKWMRTGMPRTRAGVLIANVLGDAREEVILAGVDKVLALDGSTGSTLWSVWDSSIGEFCQPQMADLNLDGALEIAVPLGKPAGLLVLRGSNGASVWKRTDLGLETYGSPVIYDVDANGYPEIFFESTDIYDGLDGSGRVSELSYDGKILRQTFSWRACAGGLSLADADHDGKFELYMGDRNTEYGRGTISFWAENLSRRWNRKDFAESSNIPMLADVNQDGMLEVVVGDLDGGLAVLKSSDGSTIRMKVGIPNDAPVHYQPSVYDIDRDGNLEMMMADGSHNTSSQDVVVWDLVRWAIDFRTNVGSCFYGPQLGDVNGDGYMEMIAASTTGIYVFDRNYKQIFKMTGLWGTLNYPAIQDIDNDGYSELVISTSGGALYAFDTPARNPKMRPRSEVQFYSEYRQGVAEYVPPPGPMAPVIAIPTPSVGKTDVPLSTTQLTFYLKDYQNDLMNYSVVTMPSVGSKSGTNVKGGKYAVSISGLKPSTYYKWNVTVTDGKYVTSTIFTFKTRSG